jgi:nitrate/nitrite-specific signal transduction histidine kinase
MNERIRQLAEQAGVDAGQTIANTICGDDEFAALGKEFNKLSQTTRDLIYKTLEQNQEKFAELIVRKCAELFEVEYGTSEVSGNQVARVLKEHFGVEE